MKCPACEHELSRVNVSGMTLDRCPHCRGIWADAGELPAIASYVKGNPKLDRLASAMADHVRGVEERKSLRDELAGLCLSGGVPDIRTVAGVLAIALAEIIRRFHRRD